MRKFIVATALFLVCLPSLRRFRSVPQTHAPRSELVLDLYCGIGTFGLSQAHNTARVVGVESNRTSVECVWITLHPCCDPAPHVVS